MPQGSSAVRPTNGLYLYLYLWLSWSTKNFPVNDSWEWHSIFWVSEKRVATAVLWDVTTRNLVEYYRRFGGKNSRGNYLRNFGEFPPHSMTPYFKRTIIVTIHCCRNLKFYTRKRHLTSIYRPVSREGNVRSFLICMHSPMRIRETDAYRWFKWTFEKDHSSKEFIYCLMSSLRLVQSLMTFNGYLLTHSMEQSSSWKANRFSESQEIPSSLWNPKVHYCVTTELHLSLSWARSILILSSHLRLGHSSGPFPSGFPTKTLYAPLFSAILATMPRQSHSSRFYQPNNIWWEVQINKTSW